MAAAKVPPIEPRPLFDRDHNQHIDEIGQRERRIEADDVDGERSAKAREPAAECEGDGECGVEH